VQLFAALLEILDEHVAFSVACWYGGSLHVGVLDVRGSPRRAMHTFASAITALPFTGS
jgi:hypothetical protein